MNSRSLLLCLTVAPLALACAERDAPETAPEAATEISGRYEVKGITTATGGPEARKIAGIVILSQQGDRYTATFELKTTYPSEGEPTAADVIGVGEGVIANGELSGETKTQLVISSVPGVDTGFAFAPRMVSTRIVSQSVATVSADGSILIDLENRAAKGEEYEPTRTRLAGHRVVEPPPVAARR